MAKTVPLKASTFLGVGFDLPPERAAKYLEGKGIVPTWSWDELAADAHHRAFTVAKLAQLDLLNTVHKELSKAQLAGTNFREFQKALEPTLKARGWWGKVEQVNPKTGKLEQVLAGSPHRLENIYRTNLQSGYQAGRKAQMEQMAIRRPYWEYLATIDNRTRPGHRQVNGVILPADHPFWKTNYPPNGYQCRCRARSLSERQLEARGGPAILGKSQIQIQGWNPDPGFASDPLDVFKPDLTRYPAKLAQAFSKAMEKAPPAPAAVAAEKEAAKLSPEQALERVQVLGRRLEDKRNKLGTEIFQINTDIRSQLDLIDQVADTAENAARLDELRAQVKAMQTKRKNLEERYEGLAARHREEAHQLFYKAEPAKFKSSFKARIGGSLPKEAKDDFKAAVKEGETWFRKVVGPGVIDNGTVYFGRTSTGRAYCRKINNDASDVDLRMEKGPRIRKPDGTMQQFTDVTKPRTVVHELAHFLEDRRQDWMDKSLAFIARRTQGESLVRLKDLFPGSSYSASEVCRPDKFTSPYIGKEYKNRDGSHYGTEVLSMGLESLYAEPFELAEKDPDFFKYLWDLIGGNE